MRNKKQNRSRLSPKQTLIRLSIAWGTLLLVIPLSAIIVLNFGIAISLSVVIGCGLAAVLSFIASWFVRQTWLITRFLFAIAGLMGVSYIFTKFHFNMQTGTIVAYFCLVFACTIVSFWKERWAISEILANEDEDDEDDYDDEDDEDDEDDREE